MLALDAVHCSYGPIAAVKGVSLEARDGTLVAILGANGAGKSTTLKAIAGLIRPWSGRIRFRDRDITRLAPGRRLGLGIALCPEGRRVFPDFSVEDNLRLGGHLVAARDLPHRIAEAITLFPVLGERMRQPAGSLSGGEQQMLAIARALMTHPTLLLLDEPSLGLSPRLTQQVFETIAEIRTRGTTVVLVEQNSAALRIADYAYVLANGSVDHEGAAGEVMNEEELKRAYLGG
jgi:branched-chain amino acid transport system ATP-binding protein